MSAALASLYLGYVLWAKFAKVIGAPPVRLDEAGEFLLFLASVVAFTIQVFAEDGGESTGDDRA